jgi:hypothetical protein
MESLLAQTAIMNRLFQATAMSRRLAFIGRLRGASAASICALLLGSLAVTTATAGSHSGDSKQWTKEFLESPCVWSSNGTSAYFVLQPGYRQVLEGRDGKDRVHLEITVLDETRTVNGVETRVIEERESANGELVEVSRNFFALCGPTNDVFYFGEEVDIYRAGKVVKHEGAWTAGIAGAREGLFIPGRPLVGARFYQEIAPGVAMDRVEIVSDNETLKTADGEFSHCIKLEETSPLEPFARGYKLFAPGVGIVVDDKLVLTKHGFSNREKP